MLDFTLIRFDLALGAWLRERSRIRAEERARARAAQNRVLIFRASLLSRRFGVPELEAFARAALEEPEP